MRSPDKTYEFREKDEFPKGLNLDYFKGDKFCIL